MAALGDAFVRVRAEGGSFRKDLSGILSSSSGTAAKAGEQTGESFASGMKSKVTKIANVMSGALLVAAAGVAVASVGMAAKFQEGMDTLVTGAGESEKQLGMLGTGIKRIAVTTGTSTEQLISGLFMISSAGFKGAGGLKVLQSAAEGAKVSSSDLGITADALTTVMTDYHMKVGQSTQAMNGLVAIVSEGKTHMQDLATSMSKVLPTGSALNVSFADIGGAMATMTSEGVSARLAATHLNAAMIAMANPNAVAVKAMAALGLKSGQVASVLTHKGLVAALQLVAATALKAGPQGSAAYIKALDQMGGGASGLAVLLETTGKHMATLKHDTDSVGKSFSSTAKDVSGWPLYSRSFGAQLDKIRETFEVLAIDIGQKLIPVLHDALDFIVRWKTPLLVVAGLIGTLALTITAVTKGIALYTDAMKIFALISDTTLMQVAAQWVIDTFAVESYGAAMAIATGGMLLLVAGLAVAAVEIVRHWKDIRQWGTDAFRAVEGAVRDTFDWIRDHWKLLLAILFGPVGLAIDAIVTHWKAVSGAFLDAYHWLDHVWQDVDGFLSRPVHDAVNTITGYWDRDFKPYMETLIRWISDAWGAALQWLVKPGEDLILGLWNGAVKIAMTAVHWAARIGTIILNAFKSFFGIHSPSSVFMAIGENLIDALGRGMLGGAKGLAKWALSGLKNLGGSLLHDVLGFLGFGGGTGGGVAGTPSGATAAANARMAQTMGGAWGSGSEWTAWNNVAMRESGWNQYALNASSGAYGIPQALPPTKMPGAAQASGGSDPGSQIGWMMSYIKSAYGDPIGAWAHELSAGWYDRGGLLPTGLSLALNTTGRPEPVGHGLGSGVEARLDAVCGLLTQLIGVTAGTPAGTAAALNGIARGAGARALYPTRMGGSR